MCLGARVKIDNAPDSETVEQYRLTLHRSSQAELGVQAHSVGGSYSEGRLTTIFPLSSV